MDVYALTDAEVADGVRAVVLARGVHWSRHANERMAERGIDRGMVYECLSKGNFSERPFQPNVSGDFQYKFTMQSIIDGELVTVAASYIPTTKLVIITAY